MSALTFAEPMPGLAPHTRFDLDPVDGADGLYSLRPEDDPSLRLFLLDATVYVPGYAPDIAGPARELGFDSPDGARVLVVAAPGREGTTVNLLAPVLVNEPAARAIQVVLDGQDYPVRARLAVM